MPQPILFDLDGTLVDSASDLHRIMNEVLAEHERAALDLPTVTSFVGDGVVALVTRAFAATGAPLEGGELSTAVGRYRERYAEAPIGLTRPYPHVAEALASLPGPLGIATNKPEGLAHAVLAGTGLAGFFRGVVGGDTLRVHKPDPDVLREAARAIGRDVASVVFVGDSEVDAATADAANVPFLWFDQGYHKGRVTGYRARFSDWRQLAGLI